jgi:protein ImuB
MRRILCIHLPNWPIQRLLAAEPALDPARPIILHARDARRGELVTACNATAHQAGVRRGMPLAEAATLAARGAESQILPAQPAADLAALARLAEHCERFSPLVGWQTVGRDSARGLPPRSGGLQTVGPEEMDNSGFEPPQEQTDHLLLDVTGIGDRFGGEQALAREVVSELARWQYRARVAIADTVAAAWALAAVEHASRRGQIEIAGPSTPGGMLHDVGSFPVAALRLPAETILLLAQLGIERIEQLRKLPRAGLAARLGQHVLLRLDQLLGLAPETIVAHRPPPQFVVEWVLEDPVESREALAHVIRRLIDGITQALAECGQGAMRLACRLDCRPPLGGGSPRAESRATKLWEVGLFRPCADAEHCWDLIRLPLEQAVLSGPVSRVILTAPLTARLENHQRELFAGTRHQTRRQWELLIDRLSSRLGPQAVVQARLVADPLPERAVEYVPVLEATCRPRLRSRQTAHRPPPRGGKPRAESRPTARPLVLHAAPLALEVVSIVPDGPPVSFKFCGRTQRVVRWWGPERIETGWQRGHSVRRDYYRVETDEGARYWLFRRLHDGQWHLHGEFA